MPSPFDIYDTNDDTLEKTRGFGGAYTYPPNWSPAVPAGTSGALGSGAGGGGFTTASPYDRTPPMYGYRRKPMGSMGQQPAAAAVTAANTAKAGQAAQGAGSYWDSLKQKITDSGMGSPGWGMTPTAGSPGAWGGWNNDPNTELGLGGPASSGWMNAWGDMNKRMAQGGMFNPLGSQETLDAIARQFAQQMGGRQAGIRNQLQSSGVSDPNNFALGALMGDLGQSDQLSQASSAAQLQSMMQNQDFLRQLFGMGMQGDIAKDAQVYGQTNMPQQGGGGIGGMLGSIGGSALGSFLKGGI